ncbi:PBP1A family penicillin-binding protein [Kiloniella laminariae]|uniref:peptidoglycan glycosyltransferase n=1 Tax=Kiloniella laminariae TaxID=454162 RepID=A0ABT4LIN7_9PROT|nr:PBP1A family penicillin-binding protein [Kiloniella laminariae]MCZ4280974.1 PBP1A family penicillin-binding protein [Kiloniella laminariae]
MATDKKTPKKRVSSKSGQTLKADPSGRTTTSRKRVKKTGTATRKASPRRSSGRKGIFKTLLTWASVVAIWGFIFLAGVVAWYAWDLPDVGDMDQISRRPSVTLMSEDGIRLASYGDLYGETLEASEMSRFLPQAIIAIEDRRFYDHFGIDVLGIVRASLVNLKAGRMAHGGSTITQQLAKNLFLSSERSLKRKVQEALLAIWLEQKFTKDQILTLYMNRVYFGAGTYGVDAAAKIYFGQSARNLGLYESALIAGLLKAPSRYNPTSSASKAERRTELVLDAMVDARFISPEEAAKAKKNRPTLGGNSSDQERFFADWILSQVDDYTGGYNGDLIVHTTLNTRHQRLAEKHMEQVLAAAHDQSRVGQGALIIMSPQGAVSAMIGGRDYRASQFNRATQALRQPGSAFKSFVFLAGLESGLYPDSRFVDKPIAVGKWKPGNYKDKYYGDVTLREAFARSMNSVAVQVSQQVGPGNVIEVAKRLGISSSLDNSPAVALGVSEVTLLELTGSYAVFANGGQVVQPHGILEIQNAQGQKLYRRSGSGLGQAVQPRHVAMMNDMMSATVAWGTGKSAQTGRPAAGKTGTTQSNRDALFIGYTPTTVAGVWFGNDDGSAMKGVTGGTLPASVWGGLIKEIEQGQPVAQLPQNAPSNVVEEKIEEVGGFLQNLFGRLKSGQSGNESTEKPSSHAPDAGKNQRGTAQFK